MKNNIKTPDRSLVKRIISVFCTLMILGVGGVVLGMLVVEIYVVVWAFTGVDTLAGKITKTLIAVGAFMALLAGFLRLMQWSNTPDKAKLIPEIKPRLEDLDGPIIGDLNENS